SLDRILDDGLASGGDARRIGQRQVARGQQRLGRRDADLSRRRVTVVVQRGLLEFFGKAHRNAGGMARRNTRRGPSIYHASPQSLAAQGLGRSAQAGSHCPILPILILFANSENASLPASPCALRIHGGRYLGGASEPSAKHDASRITSSSTNLPANKWRSRSSLPRLNAQRKKVCTVSRPAR